MDPDFAIIPIITPDEPVELSVNIPEPEIGMMSFERILPTENELDMTLAEAEAEFLEMDQILSTHGELNLDHDEAVTHAII